MTRQPASNDRAPARVPRPRGPKTAAGRAAVRLNAVRHGITSPQVPIPGVEDAGEWQAFRQAIVDDIAPVGAVEEALAGRVAELTWRLRRIAPYEAEVIAVGRERVEDDYARRASFAGPRSLREAQEMLDAALEARAALESPGLEPLSDAAAHEFVSVLVDADDATAAMPIEGFDHGVGAVDEDAWNPPLLLAAVAAMAKARGVAVETMLLRVARGLDERVDEARDRLDRVAGEIERSRRERLLPPERVMVQISKYEAHLSRQLTQALTHLETLQARRHGDRVPLARLHVSASA